MLLDSFEHAEADFAARLLIDARNEAETVILATEKSLRAPDFAEIARTELAAGERKRIESALAGSEDGPELDRPRDDSEVDAGAQRRDPAPGRGDDESLGQGGAGREETSIDVPNQYAQSHFHHRRRDDGRRVRARQAAVLASRQARVVSRRREELRRPARARLRRQLRLHDLPRHHPRGRGAPERDAGRRGRSPRHGVGPDRASRASAARR